MDMFGFLFRYFQKATLIGDRKMAKQILILSVLLL